MTAGARSIAVYALLLGLNVSKVSADEPKPAMRPISDAESVLAVYRDDWRLGSSGGPAIILAAWPDGLIVWSGDRLRRGPPYRAGRVDPGRITALLARFDKDGLFGDERLNHGHVGPDSEFTTVLIKSGKKQVEMCSWHELGEDSGFWVADQDGLAALDGRRRLEVLRKAPSEYLFFRFVWSETRSKLGDLIPGEGTIIGGKPVMKTGKVSWQEPAARGTRRP
jgi:hypothetical protein